MSDKRIKSILWLLVAALLWAVLQITVISDLLEGKEYGIMTLGGLLLVLGGLLLYLSITARPEKKIRIFLLLSGSSAVGIPVFVLLHNAVQGLVTLVAGPDAVDEPFFFTLAVIVSPLGLLVGLTGSLVRSYRRNPRPGA